MRKRVSTSPEKDSEPSVSRQVNTWMAAALVGAVAVILLVWAIFFPLSQNLAGWAMEDWQEQTRRLAQSVAAAAGTIVNRDGTAGLDQMGEMPDGIALYVLDRDGEIVWSAGGQDGLAQSADLWEMLSRAALTDRTAEEVRSAISNGQSGTVQYQINDKEQMAFYMPLNAGDLRLWMAADLAPAQARAGALHSQMFVTAIKVVFLLFVVVLFMGLYDHVTRKKMMRSNEELRVSEECFRMAVDNTPHTIFEYDLQADRLIFKSSGYEKWDLEPVLENVLRYCGESKRLDEESKKQVEDLVQKVRAGAQAAVGILHLQAMKTGPQELWLKVTVSNIFDDSGNVLRAVGLIEDITRQKRQEARFASEQEYRRLLAAQILFSYEANLTQDVYIGNQMGDAYTGGKYSEVIGKLIASNVCDDAADRQAASQLERDHLLSCYRNGLSEVRVSFKHTIPNGPPVWAEGTARLYTDEKSGDVKAVVVIKNIDTQHEREATLEYKARHDNLTKLLNREAMEANITQYLSGSELWDNAIQVFILLDLDNFKQVNDLLGHAMGDAVLADVASKLAARFRKTDFIGRLGGDEFVVFLKNVRSVNTILKNGRQLVELLDHTYEKDGVSVHVSASVGIAVAPWHGESFSELYQKADQAMYDVKRHSKAGYKIFDDTPEMN